MAIWLQRLQREIAQLAPWYDLAKKRRGRTTFGISGLSIEDAARHAASYLAATPDAPYAAGLSAGLAVKRACDDVKAYYYEAVPAQPGNLVVKEIDDWFWHETAAARVFLAIWQVCLKRTRQIVTAAGQTRPGAAGRAACFGRARPKNIKNLTPFSSDGLGGPQLHDFRRAITKLREYRVRMLAHRRDRIDAGSKSAWVAGGSSAGAVPPAASFRASVCAP